MSVGIGLSVLNRIEVVIFSMSEKEIWARGDFTNLGTKL